LSVVSGGCVKDAPRSSLPANVLECRGIAVIARDRRNRA
jgi:hypothetical protein